MKILWISLFALSSILPSVLSTDKDFDQNVLPLNSSEVKKSQADLIPDKELKNEKMHSGMAQTLSFPELTNTMNPVLKESQESTSVSNIQKLSETKASPDSELENAGTDPALTKTQDFLDLSNQNSDSDLTEDHHRIIRSPYYDPYGYPSDYYYRRRYNPYPPGVGLVLVLGGGGIGRLGGGGPRFGPGGPGPRGPGFGGGGFGGGGFGRG